MFFCLFTYALLRFHSDFSCILSWTGSDTVVSMVAFTVCFLLVEKKKDGGSVLRGKKISHVLWVISLAPLLRWRAYELYCSHTLGGEPNVLLNIEKSTQGQFGSFILIDPTFGSFLLHFHTEQFHIYYYSLTLTAEKWVKGCKTRSQRAVMTLVRIVVGTGAHGGQSEAGSKGCEGCHIEEGSPLWLVTGR